MSSTRTITAVSLEDIAGELRAAVAVVLAKHDFPRATAAVVNVAFTDPDGTWAFATAVPRASKANREMLRDSLMQSAEECDA